MKFQNKLKLQAIQQNTKMTTWRQLIIYGTTRMFKTKYKMETNTLNELNKTKGGGMGHSIS